MDIVEILVDSVVHDSFDLVHGMFATNNTNTIIAETGNFLNQIGVNLSFTIDTTDFQSTYDQLVET